MDLEHLKREKNRREVALIAEFEMEYGQLDNWTLGTEREFNHKWDEIQYQYPGLVQVK